MSKAASNAPPSLSCDKFLWQIHATFQTPPKLPNYKAPRAWSKEVPTPGKPTHPPAGRPTA
ncbi:hypothetical protein PGTUg99_021310 [Puccinia graminis f. sp. tritici]|uniref:Uncharacterized protein n=1 Tax=Puccinia graminis f. sp. tritici TaxID=56615 RepID=A0A5B0R882_PUCGR|nr:hypothetical protein PGTUg99_021310 [Puccinia graminis f. sp. tritici]